MVRLVDCFALNDYRVVLFDDVRDVDDKPWFHSILSQQFFPNMPLVCAAHFGFGDSVCTS